jgi:hypothetical protein
LYFGLVLIMGRLAVPWQLIRLGIAAAGSDLATRIAETPYAASVTVVLDEMERMVGELRAGLKTCGPVTHLIKDLHDAARLLRSEMALPPDHAWGRQLGKMRAEVASLLKGQIDNLPSRVRCLLRPRTLHDIVPGSALDLGDVAEVEADIELVGACRTYGGELALNEVTTRVYSELQNYLDTGTSLLLDSLRTAGEQDRRFRYSQVDAAVRFAGKLFGASYASLLSKAAEVALQAEKKAAQG